MPSAVWIPMGRFGRPHGVKGYLVVHSYTEPEDNILNYPEWYIKRQGEWQKLNRLNEESAGKNILVLIEGYENREIAKALTNQEIAVCQASLPALEQGEYYWHELIGMAVINLNGDQLGTVVRLLPTGSHDVLVIEGEKRYLIPYVPEVFIVEIQKDKRLIKVQWDKDL